MSKKPKKLNLNLVGKDGNAFTLIGYFSREAKKAGWDKEDINKVMKKAMKGDYQHLISVLSEA